MQVRKFDLFLLWRFVFAVLSVMAILLPNLL